jgi:hypothetical protein
VCYLSLLAKTRHRGDRLRDDDERLTTIKLNDATERGLSFYGQRFDHHLSDSILAPDRGEDPLQANRGPALAGVSFHTFSHKGEPAFPAKARQQVHCKPRPAETYYTRFG